jgi:signal transduction histidine kinase/CheY-like chemotaxis protein
MNIFKSSLFILILITLIPITIGGYFWVNEINNRISVDSRQYSELHINEKKVMLRGEVNKTIDYISYKKDTLNKNLRNELMNRVNEAHGIATNLYITYNGKKPVEEIKYMIRETVRPLRFNNGRGYYFATSLTGIEEIFSDRPELEGKDLIGMRDTNGKYVIRDMISIAKKSGEGFYEYTWTKPNSPNRNYPKLAFVKHFKPFDWFIGTGEYLDDFEEDIKNEILERISYVRYGKENDGYIFVLTYNGVLLMNPFQRELIGKNLWDMTDPDGVKVVQEHFKIAKKHDGDFDMYKWKHPVTGKETRKISFIKAVPDWQWIIGAGVYLDEVDALTVESIKSAEKSLYASLIKIFMVLFFVTVFAIFISVFISNKLRKEFQVFIDFFRKFAETNTKIDKSKLNFDEFKVLADSANSMAQERTAIQEELKKSKEKSDMANKAKNDFLASVSHEIRTPLNAIIGMTDLVLMTQLNSEQKDHLTVVKDASENLLNIMNEILNFSKIEAGKISSENKNFDLILLLNNIVKLLSKPATDKGLSIDLMIDHKIPQYVNGDQLLLSQILINLIGNSIKFTSTGGIKIHASMLKDPVHAEIYNLQFSVSDTGIGIPPDKLKTIFESFLQLDSSYTRIYGGVGLGLAITKHIIDYLKGSIGVVSEEGKGSKFYFNLDFAPGSVPEKPDEGKFIEADNDYKKYNILLAEDNIVNVKMATTILARLNHTVTVAKNGIEAIEQLKNSDFDMVLMDIEMPDMDGIEATEKIRSGEAGEKNKKIPIFAMSAHILNEIKERCVAVGMDFFIEKPINIRTLNHDLAACMNKIYRK